MEHAGDNIDVSVPALLILRNSSEFLGEKSRVYNDIVQRVPGVKSIKEARDIANRLVNNLSQVAPEKVKVCKNLQGQ